MKFKRLSDAVDACRKSRLALKEALAESWEFHKQMNDRKFWMNMLEYDIQNGGGWD